MSVQLYILPPDALGENGLVTTEKEALAFQVSCIRDMPALHHLRCPGVSCDVSPDEFS